MEAEGLFYFWLWPQAVLEDDLVPASISSIGSSTKKKSDVVQWARKWLLFIFGNMVYKYIRK